MGKTIVFANQKGGVGKTTSAVNIGAYIAAAGKKVLLVDFDPQGNLSSSVGIRKPPVGVYDVLIGRVPVQKAVCTTPQDNLFILPSDLRLSGATVELVGKDGREHYLKKALQPVKNSYDYIFIDCPPSLGLLTINGFAAAESVIVPLQCEYFALEGLAQLISTIRRVKKKLNRELYIEGLLLTMYDGRNKLTHSVAKEVRKHFQDQVYTNFIPRNVRLSESPSHGQTILEYDKNCNGARAYIKLGAEFLKKTK